jgi:hypothetical protein
MNAGAFADRLELAEDFIEGLTEQEPRRGRVVLRLEYRREVCE